ncbi:MAG: SPOR domain-containing protein [Bacteroidia bacterium]|nr:SPOR domain-containing protein [Bacteroidia bacterium]
MALDTLVYNLLHNHECVIIPSFGGFITRESPAAVNNINHTVKPYTKTVFFNPHLKDNDGLLAGKLADDKAISYDAALNEITNWVSSQEQILDDEKTFSFGKLGVFYLNNDGKKWFSPSYKLNVSSKTYGLEPVTAYEIEKLVQEEITTEQPDTYFETALKADRKTIAPVEITAGSPWKSLLIAASVALLAQFGYMWVGGDNGNKNSQQASIIPLTTISNEDNSPISEQPPVVEINPETENSELINNTEEQPAKTVSPVVITPEVNEIVTPTPVVEEVKAVTKEEITAMPTTIFYVVYGSFLMPENAQNLMTDLSNRNIVSTLLTDINHGHSFTRVVSEPFYSMEEADNFKAASSTAIPSTIIKIENKK